MLKKVVLILSVLLIIAGAGVAGAAWYVLNTPRSESTQEISLIIPKGSSIMSVGRLLTDQGIVWHPWAFRLAVMYQGTADKIQAGSFSIKPNQSPLQLAVSLTSGTEDVWVTLPEGIRVEEVAEILAASLPEFDKDEFLDIAEQDEGMLFPETYLVPKAIEAEAMHQILLDTFDKKITPLDEDIEVSGKDLSEILSMAALVQREAKDPEQMRRVAGILWNRIEIGMPLQVDATLQYAKGYNTQTKQWWSVPLAADKNIVSPFNTYQNQGLPPSPIANPGFEAISATLNPLESDDLFYLHAPDGKMYYAATLDGHNANIAKYLRNN